MDELERIKQLVAQETEVLERKVLRLLTLWVVGLGVAALVLLLLANKYLIPVQ